MAVGGAEAAREVVREGVDKLFFTGGSAAGAELYRLQAEQGRPAVLELSGRHVAVVLADADLELAASGIVWGKLVNAGRNCVSVQLVLVERSRVRGFPHACVRGACRRFHRRLRHAGPVPGDGLRHENLVADALARGARLVARSPSGAVLLADVRSGMQVVDEEIEGPILTVGAVESQAEARAWINDGGCRLSASIWSGLPARAQALALALDVGQVWINEELAPCRPARADAGGPWRQRIRSEPRVGRPDGDGAAQGRLDVARARPPPPLFPTTPGVEAMFRATVRLGFAAGLGGRLHAAGALALSLVTADAGPRVSASGRVVVVGAGFAGLAAAAALTVRGHDVTLLDRGCRVGGKAQHVLAAGARVDARALPSSPIPPR